MVVACPRRTRKFAIFMLCVVAVVFAPLAQVTPKTALADTDFAVGGEARVSYTGGDAIRVRSAPTYSGSVVISVPEGWLVAVLEGPIDDGAGSSWYKVTARGLTGYMVSDYLANPGSSGTGSQVSAAATATTTTALNLRSAASLTATVLLVMPSGASVQTTGSVQNGFTQLTYQGTTGWAASQFLTSGSAPAPAPTQGSVISNAWVIGGSLNLRAGSSTATSVLLVMPNAAQVGVTGSAVNGFTPVRYNSVDGWAFSSFLTATQPGSSSGSVIETRYSTTGLNMRSGAGTSFAVLLVIPSGAAVGITGSQTNGYFPVRYNNTNGFASASFLTTTAPGSGTAPSPTPPPASGEISSTLYSTVGLNLRSGAGTSFPVLLVIPSGAPVGVTGAQTNGFYRVRYNNTNGFAASQFLTSSAPGSGTTPSPAPGSGNTGGGGIVWPVTAGTWEITQGYNGSSHINTGSTGQYYYSLDLARQDRTTGGRSVYSPVNGTIRWFDRASGGIAIDMGNGFAVAMFHVTVDRSLVAGRSISQGDYIGFLSGPGQEGFVQFAHLHFTVWATTDGGNWSRQAVPFTGQNAISGNSYPDIGGTQQWTGTLFNP